MFCDQHLHINNTDILHWWALIALLKKNTETGLYESRHKSHTHTHTHTHTCQCINDNRGWQEVVYHTKGMLYNSTDKHISELFLFSLTAEKVMTQTGSWTKFSCDHYAKRSCLYLVYIQCIWFIQYIFTEHLLYVRSCLRCQEYKNKKRILPSWSLHCKGRKQTS